MGAAADDPLAHLPAKDAGKRRHLRGGAAWRAGGLTALRPERATLLPATVTEGLCGDAGAGSGRQRHRAGR